MTWGYVAIAGATLVGGYMASESAGDAADQQAAGTAAGIAEQRRQADRTYNDYAPYRETGKRALSQYETEINSPLDMSQLTSDPGYQFGLKQGQLALDRKASAGGGRVSGASLKSAAQYGTDYATTKLNDAYQRRQDRLNRIASLAQIGQTSTAGSAAAGANSANAISGLLSDQGNASGAARLAQGNIWGNAANQIGAAASKYYSQPSKPFVDSSPGWDSGAASAPNQYNPNATW